MDTFPVHLLPDRPFLWVLKRMEFHDQLAYSFCSTKTKKAVKSLNLKAIAINFDVCDSIKIEIWLDNSIAINFFINYGDYFPKIEIIADKTIEFHVTKDCEVTKKWKWKFQNFECNKWLHHFCEVLHHPRIDDLCFNDDEINDAYIEPIQKVIEGLQIGFFSISDQLTNDFAKKALEVFPNYDKLFLYRIPFGSSELNKLLIQNLKSIGFSYAEEIEIDQVLLTNSERIQLNESRFTEKEFNRLLKLWIHGSNPRLKHFFTRGQPQHGNLSLDKNIVLKGIKYEQVPLDSEEVYRYCTTEICYNETKLAGGFRIWRFNGTTAVIVVTEDIFEFIAE
ncbi:unnamed protein product [Caenorhabditis brenneri]